MAGATRASKGRQPPRVVPSTQPQPSSGINVPDENGDAGYVTPQKTESPRTDISHLSQSSESLAFVQYNGEQEHSTAAIIDETDALGVHIKEVISVVSRLEGLGLQQLSIQLPKCVVLGEQSSGKSSVIEAISGIRTPRASGTCTRCPLFIKLERPNEQEADWHARITLRKNYNYTGGQREKFPGWAVNTKAQEIPFATCGSPNELEDMIHRAQFALVHPLEESSAFAQEVPRFDPNRVLEVSFSPNIVCIYVSHPALPDLSFYDLPGLIGQAENPADVNIVKRLVSGTPSHVLLEVLNGIKFGLGHGYFVVKNPDQLELDSGLSHQEARKQERNFFAMTEPWRTSLQAHRGRFGAGNLQQYLSEKLASQMIKALPAIYEQIKVRLDQVEADLSYLPEPPTHGAARAVADILHSFSDHVRKEMEAEYPYKTWRNTWGDIQKSLMDNLLAMKPTMMLGGHLDIGVFAAANPGKSKENPCVLSDDDDESGAVQDTPLPTPSKKRKVENTPPSKTPNQRFATPAYTTPTKKTADIGSTEYRKLRWPFKLDEVADDLRKNSKSKIPDQLQPRVIDDMILKTIKDWSVPMESFFEGLELALKEHIRSVFETHFKKVADTKLYLEASSIIEEILKTSITEQRNFMAVDILRDELEGPYIFHEEIFDREKHAIRETYRRARFAARLKKYMEEAPEQLPGRELTEENVLKDERKRLEIGKEPYEFEINVISRITSYYLVAARRFHDSICMRIESKFFKRLRVQLREDMEASLGIHDEDGTQKAIRLLAESPQRAEFRRSLNAQKDALLKGQEHLDALQAKHGNNINASQGSNGHVTLPFSSSWGPTSTPSTGDMVDITRSGRVRR
ncbi:hypothetical protein N0V90_004231 [Kalmusia sp. IMI 367209]|nr:hypothetical protein N0V90_004231 [Kalmusia sp. IMI 367209]